MKHHGTEIVDCGANGIAFPELSVSRTERKSIRRFLSVLFTFVTLSVPTLSKASGLDFILQTRPGASPYAIAKTYAIKVKDVAPEGAPFALFTSESNSMENLERALENDPRVLWFDLDAEAGLDESDTTSRGGTIPVVGSVDHLDDENAHLLSQIHWTPSMRKRTLANVRVAVLDTGLSPKATNLWAKAIRYRYQIPSFVARMENIYDLPDPRFGIHAVENQAVGHGTMVTGLISEIAPNAQFIVEKVASGSGTATSWSIIRGLADAVAAKADLVNISLGAQGHVVAFEQAFEWARSKGLLIVAAAGNNGIGRLVEPAALDGVIAVAGVDATNHKASFSNWDRHTAACAPCIGIRSVNWDGNMAIWSGTSFSAPLVAGALSYCMGAGRIVNSANAAEYLRSGGAKVDALNPTYKGEIGCLLDVSKLAATVLEPEEP